MHSQLRKRLAPHQYYECAHTPGIWRHVTIPIQFTLIVADFGVKYFGKEHADHLIRGIKSEGCEMKTDWEGSLYCGITLKLDYDSRTLDISMPGYIAKLLLYKAPPKMYGKGAQDPIPDNIPKKIDRGRINVIQQVIRGVLSCARAVGNTVLVALSTTTSE